MSKIYSTKIRKTKKYQQFIEWYGTPKNFREPKTMLAFSKKIGISPDTLTNWKNQPNFEKEAYEGMKGYISIELLGHAISALHKNIMKHGRGSDVKLMFQLAGVWGNDKEERRRNEQRAIGTLPLEKKLLIAKKLKKWKQR